MVDDTASGTDASAVLRCPECRAPLKQRRSRGGADACERVCGGCGRIFDICDQQSTPPLAAAEGNSLEK